MLEILMSDLLGQGIILPQRLIDKAHMLQFQRSQPPMISLSIKNPRRFSSFPFLD